MVRRWWHRRHGARDGTAGLRSGAARSPHGRARRVARSITPDPPAPGFIGEGHLAVMVVSPDEFAANDPFILLADDRLELPDGQPAGGPHPHAGFETVTFMLEGSLHDRDEGVLE